MSGAISINIFSLNQSDMFTGKVKCTEIDYNTCKLSNVVAIIGCTTYGPIYDGQTTNMYLWIIDEVYISGKVTRNFELNKSIGEIRQI